MRHHTDWKHWDKARSRIQQFSDIWWQTFVCDLPVLVTVVQHQWPNSALWTSTGKVTQLDIETTVPRPAFDLNLTWFVWHLWKSSKDLLEQKVMKVQEWSGPFLSRWTKFGPNFVCKAVPLPSSIQWCHAAGFTCWDGKLSLKLTALGNAGRIYLTQLKCK